MSSISNEIVNMQNATAQYKAATETKTTGTTEMDADTFLTLMLQELQYQDPMDPVDNKEFLAQQAQFTQVSETQKLNENITSNNTIMQTLALVGKDVTLTDPDNEKNTISGNVSEASFNGDGASIVIDGKEYPVSLIKSVKEPTASNS